MTFGNKKLILIPLLALGLIFAPLGKVFADSCPSCHLIAPSHSVDKDFVERGETLTYTIGVENIGDEAIDPVFVAETFSPYVDYIPGTTWAFKGDLSVNVTDNWLADGLNLGILDPGQTTSVVFQATVRGDAPDGAFIESVAQIKKTWLGGDVNEWIQCAAQSTLIGSVDNPLYSPTKEVDKSVASPGDVLIYTVRVVNTGDVELRSVYIADTLPAFVTYVSGSALARKNGQTVSVTDAWLTDGLNLGDLGVGGEVVVGFEVTINDDAPDGQLIENVTQFKTEELPNWIQCAARTVVEVGEVLGEEEVFSPVIPPKDVPKVLAATGPEHIILTAMYLGYLGFLVRKLKLTKYL